MNDFMAILAVLIALGIFVPCALFASGKWRPGQEDKPASREVATPDPPTYKVEQTWTQRVTNVAVTWVRKSIGAGGGKDDRQPEALTGRPGGDLDDGDEIPDDAFGDTGDDVPDGEPTVWDAEVVRPGDPPTPQRVTRGLRRALPWLRHADSPRRETHPDGIDALAGDLKPPAPVPAVDVEIVRDRPDLPDLTAVADAQPAAGQPLTVDTAPVELEGVDMSQAPLVPSGSGSAVRLATAGQLRAALATGGYSRLMAWLRAFRKASNNTLTQANTMHADALLAARRTRNAYAQAMQAFQAIQTDKLDRQMINHAWQMLERTQAQAAAAANVTRATAQFVVASGGQQPAVAAAVATLQRNHGQIAAAVKASPVNPVENVNWYRQ